MLSKGKDKDNVMNDQHLVNEFEWEIRTFLLRTFLLRTFLLNVKMSAKQNVLVRLRANIYITM